MPKKGSKPKSRKKASPSKELSASTIVYSGAITRRTDNRQEDCHTVVMRYLSAPISSSIASGTIATHVGSSPANCSGWSNYAALYDEYRTLGVEAEWIPSKLFDPSGTTVQVPLCLVVDNDNSTDLTTYAQAQLYASCKTFMTYSKFKQTARMNEASDSTFHDAQSPTDYFSIKIFGTGANISTVYGFIAATYRVQFRGSGTS